MPPATPNHPWQRQPDETPRAYHAFTLYRDLGPNRSIDKAYRQHKSTSKGQQKSSKTASKTRAPGRWYTWSRIHNWITRTAAWDTHTDQLRHQHHLQQWLTHQQHTREQNWHTLQALNRRLQALLETPITPDNTWVYGHIPPLIYATTKLTRQTLQTPIHPWRLTPPDHHNHHEHPPENTSGTTRAPGPDDAAHQGGLLFDYGDGAGITSTSSA